MVTWKKALGYMNEELHHNKLAEEEQFDPGYKADEEEFLSNLRHLVSDTIEDYSDHPKEEQKENITYQKSKTSKRWIVLAASLVLVLGIGATSIGSKSYVLSVIDMLLGNKTAIRVDNSDSKKLMKEDTRFNEARDKINKIFNIELARIEYLPHLMIFKKSTIDSVNKKAEILYKDDAAHVITYTISMNLADSVSVDKEHRLVQEYDLLVQDHEIIIREYENKETKKRQLVAAFSDNYAFYNLSSNLNQNEFDKIIKSLYFHEKK